MFGCAACIKWIIVPILISYGVYYYFTTPTGQLTKVAIYSKSDTSYYTDVTWLTSHNSFAYKNGSFKKQLAPNQVLTIEQQLQVGVRSFMIDLHYDGSGKNVVIGHEDYLLFEQPFLPFLDTIRIWLDNNKNDIITIHLESYIRDHKKIMDILRTANLDKYLFDLKTNANRWPTIGEMKKTNKRLVIFSDKTQDTGFGIMSAYEYMETQYNLHEYPSCQMRTDRARGVASLFVFNHFYSILPIPNAFSFLGINRPNASYLLDYLSPIRKINNYNYMRDRICYCFHNGQTKNKWPNFVAVDFIGMQGDEAAIVSDINKGNIKCP